MIDDKASIDWRKERVARVKALAKQQESTKQQDFVCFAPLIFESNVVGIPCGPLAVPNSGHKDGHSKNNKTFDEVSVIYIECFMCVLCVYFVCVRAL